MPRRWFLLVLLASLLPAHSLATDTPGSPADQDRDGLSDSFEDALLERFRPTLMIGRSDCDGLPAEFRSGSPEPIAVSANGTIYGQVFPIAWPLLADAATLGAAIELHYYHLWRNDCGDFGHKLDAEFVAALITAPEPGAAPEDWQAVYWFGAAHEGTLCDASNGARAAAIDAVTGGPVVWVSEHKHASFLTEELCSRIGCGGDRCRDMAPLEPAAVVNIGEPGHPLNGAVWVDSDAWPLRAKMGTVFDDSGYRRFADLGPDGVGTIAGPVPPTKALLLAGNRTIGSVGTTGKETGEALGTARDHSGNAVMKTLLVTGRGVKRSLGAVGRWLFKGGAKPPPPARDRSQ